MSTSARRSGAVEPLIRMRSEVGEGPVWDHRTHCLAWVDILGRLVHLTDVSTGVTRSIPLDRDVGAIALMGEDAYMLAVRDGLAAIEGDVVRMIASVVDDENIRMNDGAADPAGRFVAGTMAYDFRPGAGTLYVRHGDGAIETLVEDVTVSNGLAWSDDGDTLFYVDSPTRGIDVFDYDVATGSVRNRRRHISVPEADGLPDGITLDAEGCLWVALVGGGKVRRYSPEGEVAQEIVVPASRVTACAFGDVGLDRLYITTSNRNMNMADPANALAGALFVADPGCLGRPEPVIPPVSAAEPRGTMISRRRAGSK